MMSSALFAICLGVSAFEVTAAPPLPEMPALMRSIRAGHPRLIVDEKGFGDLRKLAESNPTAAGYLKELKILGETALKDPPIDPKTPRKEIHVLSNKVLDRVVLLSLLYRLDGDRKWANRAVEDLLAGAAFEDWYPYGTLGAATMTAALALGYDWLYDALTPDQRKIIRAAIVEKGLKECLPFYEKRLRWAMNYYNWNNVCNGGMIVGCLAVADEEPEIAEKVLAYALQSGRRGLSTYAPDGGWPEGPGYWEYATIHTLLAAYALRSATGGDCGMLEHEGLSQSGYFPYYLTGSSGQSFNFADADPNGRPRNQQFALAKWFADSTLACIAREVSQADGVNAFDLIWFDPRGSLQEVLALPLDRRFRRAETVTMRSAWKDPQAIFVGLKAGNNASGHSHLDLGTFVLDALGQRWADELGPMVYQLPGYFGKERFTYYRSGTVGHNTLSIDAKNQNPKAVCAIPVFKAEKDDAFAVADLTAAYSPAAEQVLRGIWLRDGRRRVLVQDELKLAAPAEIVWQMHTQAAISLNPQKTVATLAKNNKTLYARILVPEKAAFAVQELDCENDGGYYPIKNVRKLLLRLPEKTASARIGVLFSTDLAHPPPQTIPLKEWNDTASGHQ
jgi:hypothetical protein